MDYEAAVRAGEALVAGYLLIACAQGACPPTHFGKGQLQPACDGLGNVLQLMESADRGKDSQDMVLSVWKVSSPPSH